MRGNSFKNRSLAARLKLDTPLMLGVFCCFALSIIILYSAKMDFKIIERHVIRVIPAFVTLLLVTQISPRVYKAWAPWLYFVTLVLLVAVLVIGDISKGAQRWLDLKIVRFQPAELMKIALPMMVSNSLEQQVLPPSFKALFMPLVYILVPVILIAIQPDLGTAILVGSAGIFVIFFAGITWRFIFTTIGLGVAALPLFWYSLRDYQKQRILTLLNPERDPLGTGYHIIQSKIALGSGGLTGKGWLNGTQSHLEFLPERTTDFIFAVFGEEFGFIGFLFLITIYLLIVMRGLYIAVQAGDTFSRLLSGSLIMTFFVYVFVNIGMVSGILPVVGIPLPLISFGGTSWVTILSSFGILMAIHTHKSLLRR